MASLRSGTGPGDQQDKDIDSTTSQPGDSVVPTLKGSLSLITPRPHLVVLDLDKTVGHLVCYRDIDVYTLATVRQ